MIAVSLVLLTDYGVTAPRHSWHLDCELDEDSVELFVQIMGDFSLFLVKSEDWAEAREVSALVVGLDPEATGAYLQLGDACWELKLGDEARNAYKTYVEQMKQKGKEKKIPARVLERLK